MLGDRRAERLARLTADLAAGAEIDLPDDLQLWALAGARPDGTPVPAADPADALGRALEATLAPRARRAGAHFTPVAVADRVADLALASTAGGLVVDPACGGGALLVAAGRHLAARGTDRAEVARDRLWGADLDPLATAVTEAAIALWSGGTAPAPGHLVVADTLRADLDAWSDPPPGGFDALVGNPPFQGQLDAATARSRTDAAALRHRFGDAAAGYVDTAALFLLAGIDLVRSGGRVAMVLPQSVIAARDASAVRAAVARRAALRALWAPDGHVFDAKVHVVVASLEVGGAGREDGIDWAGRLATARGVPEVDLVGRGTVADLAAAVAGFRDEYYGLVGHVREAGPSTDAPLVTSGCIDVGACTWGRRTTRFAKQRWARPEVDLAGLAASDERTAAWVARVRVPKVVVASQTRVLEAVPDVAGTWVPATPVVSVVPHDAADLHRLAAVLCAPPVAAWAARRAAGSALSAGAVRVSTSLVLAAPLPSDPDAWLEATAALAEGDLDRYAAAATAMYDLAPATAAAVRAWWRARLPA